MKSETLTQLHAPLIPILRDALALAPLPRAGVALDLACGPGLKAALLLDTLGPGVLLVGVDIDPAAFREQENRAPSAENKEQRTKNKEPRTENGHPQGQPRTEDRDFTPSPRHPVTPSPRHPFVGVVGDALALPLRDGCCDAAFCIAALGLFADRLAALRELRRALRSGGLALLTMGTQSWAQVVHWPPDVAARLATAYAQALVEGAPPIPAVPDLASELADLLTAAGFAAPFVRAFWLDDRRPTADDRLPTTDCRLPTADCRLPTADCRLPTADCRLAMDHPLASELPLLPWRALRGLLARWLPAAELARCDALAAVPDVVLCTLALVALAYAA